MSHPTHSCCSCSLLLFQIHTHICICKRHYCFAVNTAHASLLRRSRCLSLRMVHLFLDFLAHCCIHWMFFAFACNRWSSSQALHSGWGQWWEIKDLFLPKNKSYFHSSDSIRSPQTSLCCEHFSHTGDSAPISPVLFDCTWYVQVFSGLWELSKKRILFVQQLKWKKK